MKWNEKYMMTGIHRLETCPTHLHTKLGEVHTLYEWAFIAFKNLTDETIKDYFKDYTNKEVLDYLLSMKSIRLESYRK